MNVAFVVDQQNEINNSIHKLDEGQKQSFKLRLVCLY